MGSSGLLEPRPCAVDVDLKREMELQPGASRLDRPAVTPDEAAAPLRDAVAVLEAGAPHLATEGTRLCTPAPSTLVLIVVIDAYAELADEARAAIAYADPIARRGRAVVATHCAATHADPILGQGMLAAG